MFRFLHAADIHLDSPLKGLEVYQDAPVDQIRGAVRRAFDNLVDLAIQEDAAFVLLAGDLFDGDWKDYNTGLYFINRMGLLREAGIHAFIVSGNHDAASQISRALHLPDNVRLLSHKKPETMILEDLNVAIHGQSFPSRIVSEDLTQFYPQGEYGLFNIGLLHTALTGRPGHEPYAPCTLDALRSKGYQYWALGHVHQREEVSQEPWVIFPGNIQGRHIRETGPKGCTMVTVDEGQVLEVQHHDIDVLRWAVCRVDLNECETHEECLDRVRQSMEDELIRAEGRPIAVRLVLEGVTSLHRQLHEKSFHWMEEFKAISASLVEVWLEKILFHTRKNASLEEVSGVGTPISVLNQAVENFRLGKFQLLDLIPELEQLRSKLPPDLISDDDPFNVDEEKMEALCEDIKELLTGRMLRQEDRYED
ncbi:Metallophosphoesterase [uncultured Desulfobacterium sp.]|uniref:Metallophosphoesterase n=1 Tax=uncultured Desulfobacterium sp. TaxID=201089 RepID=A0A445N191_9BACT|nr:Metallophosphoesterase [uncultured Desulfobacterium sp.]